MIKITDSISLDDGEIEESFIRAPGPGGQHVNKVETAVQLRFNAAATAAFTGAVYLRLKKICGRRMTADGVIIITASRFRSQLRNRADARERLIALIVRASTSPKNRRATKPSAGAKIRRVEAKKKRSTQKKHRHKKILVID